MTAIAKAAIIGGGVIGAGWIARLVLNGIDVAVFDLDPQAERKINEVVANARRAYQQMMNGALPPSGRIRMVDSIVAAVTGAQLIQESVPERLELKHDVLKQIDTAADPDALIGSSTSGLKPSDMQAPLAHPERMFVAHPFNPVYLLPLVEIVGGTHTSADTISRAMDVYRSIGMKPVHVKKEIEAFVADRLLEAIWRESLWLIKDGICTTGDLDDIVRYGFGLRYAQMGVFETYRTAGGEAGMRHFLAQFGPCLQWPWTKLTDVPDFDDALVELIAGQSDEQSGHMSIRELERARDDNLVVIMDALSRQNNGEGWGAGNALNEYRKRLSGQAQE